jgi:anti-sigma B factor antagonist
MNGRLECQIEEHAKAMIFTLKGNLDVSTISNIMTNIDALLTDHHPKFLFDCAELKHIDSSGVGALIVLFKRIRANKQGEMKILHLQGQPEDIFRLLRLDHVFELYTDLEQALQSFG